MDELEKIKKIIGEKESNEIMDYLETIQWHLDKAQLGDTQSALWIRKKIQSYLDKGFSLTDIPQSLIDFAVNGYMSLSLSETSDNNDTEVESQVLSKKKITRQDFISINEAVRYLAEITKSSTRLVANLLSDSDILDVLGVYELLPSGLAIDSTPISDNDDCTAWNIANEGLGSFINGDIKEQLSRSTLNIRIMRDIEAHGWERQSFFDFVSQLLKRLASSLNVSTPQALPSYLDPNHLRYSQKLAAAINVWQAMDDTSLLKGKGTVAAMKSWLESRYKELGLVYNGSINNTGIEEVAKVANWDKVGGTPSTPNESHPPYKAS